MLYHCEGNGHADCTAFIFEMMTDSQKSHVTQKLMFCPQVCVAKRDKSLEYFFGKHEILVKL